MHNIKRSIAILLCLAVLCAFAPFAVLAAETNAGKILNDAYALAKDTALDYDATLTGKITKINTPYDPTYKNVSVTIEVSGYADKPMLCYRVKGDGADTLALGDTITVTGKIKNYNGTIEFDAGCTLDKVVKGNNEAVVAPTDPKKIVDAAFALDKGASLPYMATLTGKITEAGAYDSSYKNITVIIEVSGSNGKKTIECYRMKGEGAENLKVGDVIAVTGQLTRFYKAATEDKAEVDKIEFNSGCTFVMGTEDVVAPTDPRKIVDAAFALEPGAKLPYEAQLTGKVTEIVTEYSEQYGNITVNIEVDGSNIKKIIECFRLKGDGVYAIKVGDTITVTGELQRYVNETTEDKPSIDKIEFINPILVFRTESTPYYPSNFRVVGNADWMGTWDPASNEGIMEDLGNGVYQKCFENIKPGIYEFKITQNGTWDLSYGDNGYNYVIEVTRTCRVTITFDYVKCTISALYFSGKYGDINNDGRTNTGDVARLYAHIRSTNPLTDPMILLRADLSNDGKINIVDTAKAYAYVRGTDPTAIVDDAYNLLDGATLSHKSTLNGTILEIVEPYNPHYNCITVSMAISGREDYPIICTRLMGENLDKIEPRDIITVNGTLQKFYGIVEFQEGCRLIAWEHTKSEKEIQQEIVDAAYALANNTSMTQEHTLTGKVRAINKAYSDATPYINITIQIAGREDKPISCYRLVGNKIDLVGIDDTVTIKGTLRNFSGTVEFSSGCQLINLSSSTSVVHTNPKKIVDAAFALAKGASLPYTATLTGTITTIVTEYSVQYQNITVVIQVEGTNGKKSIECYRMKGDGADWLKVGDVIKVTGILTHYYKDATEDKPAIDKIEFGAGCTFTK